MDPLHMVRNETEQRFKMLFEMSRRLVVSLNLNDILQAAVDGVATVAGLDTAAVYLLDDSVLRLYNTMPPLPSDVPESLRYAMVADHPHIRQAIETASPLFIPDVINVTLSAAEQAVVSLRTLRTILYLPLIAEAEVLGAMIVGSVESPVVLADTAVDLSYTLANFAALAVKNAQLFEAGKRYSAELEQTLADRKKTGNI